MIDQVGCRSRERQISAVEFGELLRVRTDRIVDRYRSALIADRHPIVDDARVWPDYADHARRVVADCTVTLATERVSVAESVAGYRLMAQRGHDVGMPPEEEIRAASLLFSVVLHEVRALVAEDRRGVERIALAAEVLRVITGMHLEQAARRHDDAALRRDRRRSEDERRRLARDLHDRVGNTISAAARRLEILEAAQLAGASTTADAMQPAVSALTAAMHEVSDLTTALRAGLSGPRLPAGSGRDPGAGSAAGYGSGTGEREAIATVDLRVALESAVAAMCLESTSVAIRVVGSSAWLPDRTRDEVFVIVREALRNAVRHSGAAAITVEVDIAPDRVVAVVVDDGVGFDAARTTRTNGLSSMAERAELLGGEVAVTSRPGQGTSVLVHIPARMVRSA
ncbi:sensor histidine kinase [Millisia brevis]|uniref:sensor histidine kinase n=1 Tax=Millisia brevis TaxID=264148 RepID=UPI000829D9BD|nr:ATP-binding protein [Millisia brevis]